MSNESTIKFELPEAVTVEGVLVRLEDGRYVIRTPEELEEVQEKEKEEKE